MRASRTRALAMHTFGPESSRRCAASALKWTEIAGRGAVHAHLQRGPGAKAGGKWSLSLQRRRVGVTPNRQEVCMHSRSHGLHCVLPPMVLENIARKGDEAQREWATRALSQDHSI